MVFLVLVPSPPYVAIRRRELLPRGFTLTLTGGLFSVTACKRLLPSVLSTAEYSTQSGLSSEANLSDRSFYLYLFLGAEFALELVVLCIDLCNCFLERWSDVLAALMALH